MKHITNFSDDSIIFLKLSQIIISLDTFSSSYNDGKSPSMCACVCVCVCVCVRACVRGRDVPNI